jgi:hypothetical protein
MATRKKPRRPAKKATTKKTNSKITEAQKAASEKRIEQDTLRGQSGAERANQAGGILRFSHPLSDGKQTQPAPSGQSGAGQEKQAEWYPGKPYSVLDGPVPKKPKQGKPEPPAQPKPYGGIDPRNIGNPAYQFDRSTGTASRVGSDVDKGRSIPGVGTPIQDSPNPLANPGLYGVSNAKRAQNLVDLRAATLDVANNALKAKGNAVYMGSVNTKIRNSGPERFNDDGSTTTVERPFEQIENKDTLMAWLSDESKVAQIKDAANKAGLAVSTYDDISKLWTNVVSQAASSFSLGGSKVTPWALIQLRGKYAVNGAMPDKVTTSTSIDEMDPATARLMFEKTVSDQLGRAPTKAEVDDFIAKAQTIAQQNPAVTTTTQKIGFDGNVTGQTSRTTGGAQTVNDQAQVASMDQAKQSEDYAAYQAAGNYFPMLFQALQAPV